MSSAPDLIDVGGWLDGYRDPSLVVIEIESNWQRAPFDTLARKMHASLKLPDWKLRETSRNLQRIFDFAVADGKSFADALDIVEGEFQRILCQNGILHSLT